jgi:hypothetical protein
MSCGRRAACVVLRAMAERFTMSEWRNGASHAYMVMDVTGHAADGQPIGRILEYGVNSPRGTDDKCRFHFKNGRVMEDRTIRSRRRHSGDQNVVIDAGTVMDDATGDEMIMGVAVEWL